MGGQEGRRRKGPNANQKERSSIATNALDQKCFSLACVLIIPASSSHAPLSVPSSGLLRVCLLQLSMTVIAFICKGGKVLQHSDPTVVWVYLLGSCQMLCACVRMFAHGSIPRIHSVFACNCCLALISPVPLPLPSTAFALATVNLCFLISVFFTRASTVCVVHPPPLFSCMPPLHVAMCLIASLPNGVAHARARLLRCLLHDARCSLLDPIPLRFRVLLLGASSGSAHMCRTCSSGHATQPCPSPPSSHPASSPRQRWSVHRVGERMSGLRSMQTRKHITC